MRLEELKKHINLQPDRFGRSVILSSDNAVLSLYSFQPGQAMSEHTHPFSGEFISVIEGEALISAGVESVLAPPHSVTFVPPEAVHSIHNHGSTPLLVTSFMSPKP